MNRHCFISKSTEVNASVSTVFGVLSDIEHWNEWTKSVTKISYLPNNNFLIGGKALVHQPKLPASVWTITEIIPNRFFFWQMNSHGVKITAKHIMKETDKGTFIEHQVIYEGLFAWLVYKLTAKLTKQYLGMEITGLKHHCEEINQDRLVTAE